MSEEDKTPKEGEKNDDLGNLKAEFGRKFDNTNTQLQQLQQSNKALLEAIAKMNTAPAKPKKTEPTESLSDLILDDTEKAVGVIEDRVADKVTKVLEDRDQTAAIREAQQQTLVQIVRDYPELQDQGHEMYKKAVEAYEGFSEEEKNHKWAYKFAAEQAASELGIMKSQFRDRDTESFSLSSKSSGTKPQKDKSEVDPATLAFAEAVGLKVDKDTEKKLTDHAKRDWGRYK